MTHLRGLHVDRIFPRTLPMDKMIPTQPNTVNALDSKTERFERTGSSFETDGSGFDRTGSGFTRNWSICLVLPVYGIIVCLVVWNMHLQAQLLLMRTHSNVNVRLSGHLFSLVFLYFVLDLLNQMNQLNSTVRHIRSLLEAFLCLLEYHRCR